MDVKEKISIANSHKFSPCLAGSYKIHLMPRTKYASKLVAHLLSCIRQDEELQFLINSIKIHDNFSETKKQYKQAKKLNDLCNRTVAGRIVIYPAEGKSQTQQLLNKLYRLLPEETFPGLGINPRYNAKVNDLIYVAQSDGDTKSFSFFAPYYEGPYRVYYDTAFIKPIEGDDHYLTHPTTGKHLTRPQ